MSEPLRTTIVVAASLVAFLAAAKFHGMQLRREREAQGITQVDFRGKNPPFVEQLWRAERWRFWGLALALGGVAALLRLRGSWLLIAALLWGPTVSFLVTGGLSIYRRAHASTDGSTSPR